MNNTIRCVFPLLAVSLLLAAPANVSAISMGVPVGAAAPHARIGMNPHLHGAAAVARSDEKGHPPERPTERPTEHPDHRPEPGVRPGDDRFHHPEHPDHRDWRMIHHAWSNRWDYVAWRWTHLHYGQIRGFILTATGQPVRGAHVWLQQPGGRGFRLAWKRHATSTDISGRFVMRHVLAQGYRLATKQAHVEIAVHPGTLTMQVLQLD